MDALSDMINMITHQYSSLPLLLTKESCAGKTYIVTGSNSGLGFEAVQHLVRLGSRQVILAVRSESRGQAALAAIESATGVRGVAEVWVLDMSSYESILSFTERVKRDLERVDAIIENASAADKDWILCEGMESTMTVNVLGTLFLAVLLMPYLEVCARNFDITPRIVIVTSGLGFARKTDLAKIDRNDILRNVNDATKWSIDGTNRYALSKLLQMFAIRRLASIACPSRTGVIISMVSPGLCKTGLVRYADSGTQMKFGILNAALGRSAEWGSRNLLYGLAAGEESHGKYLTYCDIKEEWIPDWVSNKDGEQWGERLWEEVALELERVQPGCVTRALKT